jgi:hypothetical protein
VMIFSDLLGLLLRETRKKTADAPDYRGNYTARSAQRGTEMGWRGTTDHRSGKKTGDPTQIAWLGMGRGGGE